MHEYYARNKAKLKKDMNKMLSLISGELEEASGKKYKEIIEGIWAYYENELLDKFMDYFAPFREKREELMNNMDYVYEILQKGAEKARSIATSKMDEVRSVVGLLDKNY